jgi:hypothetical protein
MVLKGLLAFALFWIIALAFGTMLVLLVLGGGAGWLLLAAVPAVVLLWIGTGSRRGHRRP